MRDNAGFTLIEVACVLAVVALVASLALPAQPRGTSSARLEGYALQIAALLKSDRIAAIRRGTSIATRLDADARTVRSGASDATVAVPSDVVFDALLAERCGDRRVGSTIDFLPSGESCGGSIAIARQGLEFQVRVNWLTGAVEIVSAAKS
jgi:general secretion pathway protein H